MQRHPLEVKTRQQLADDYGISRKTLYNWLKKVGIRMEPGLITPLKLKEIHEAFGAPGTSEKVFIPEDYRVVTHDYS